MSSRRTADTAPPAGTMQSGAEAAFDAAQAVGPDAAMVQRARERLRTLSALRSNAAGLRHLVLHASLLFASASLVLVAPDSVWLLPAMLLHGTLLVFLFCPLHEASHRSAFRSRRLNVAVAWLAGALLLMPPSWFRHFHMAHHRFTQDPLRDPELAQPKPRSLSGWLWHVSGLPLWTGLLRTLLALAAGRADLSYLPERERRRTVYEARLLLAGYAAVAIAGAAAQSWLPLLLWVGPALLGQPLLRLFLLAEHAGCPQVADMFANTRTTLTNRAMRALCWNMNFHAEHHAYPSIPFHALPEAHALLHPRLQVTAPGYLAANREILAEITEAAHRQERPEPRPPRAAP